MRRNSQFDGEICHAHHRKLLASDRQVWVSFCRPGDQSGTLSVLWAAKGDVLRAEGAATGAIEGAYHNALEIARSQSARMWELRAATRLARFWHSEGRTAEAHDLLSSVHSWFTEGFDTADLKEPRSLLDELS